MYHNIIIDASNLFFRSVYFGLGKEQKINMLNDKILKLEELINTLINKNAQS